MRILEKEGIEDKMKYKKKGGVSIFFNCALKMQFFAHSSLAIVIYQKRFFPGIQEKSTSEIVLSSSRPDACFSHSFGKTDCFPLPETPC